MSLLLEKLEAVLLDCSPAAVAVSGGGDSMTLAFAAGRVLAESLQLDAADSFFFLSNVGLLPSSLIRIKRQIQHPFAI